jgi:lysophospholipase L1-like esterase
MSFNRMRPLSVVLAILFSLPSTMVLAQQAVAPQKREHSAIKPAPRGGDSWVKRHASFNERVKKGNADLLMIGDSITHGWEGSGAKVWEKYYGKRNAVNLGIGGDRTQHVLWRLENGNIEGLSPKLAVLMIGTNNSGSNTPEEIAEGVEAIVKKLRTELPKMKILVLAIFPRGADDSHAGRQVNMKANELIAKLADGKMVHFLSINDAFLNKDRILTPEIMPDLLHPKEKGYGIWAEAMEPTIVKLMEEKK